MKFVCWRAVISVTTGLVVSSLVLGCKTTEPEQLLGDAPPARIPEVKEQAPPRPRQPTKRSSNASIRAGDTLELFVEEDDSFNGTYTVRERGDIIIPNVGRIPLSGMSVVDAGARIKAELESSQLKNASVILDRTGMAPLEESYTPQEVAQVPDAPKLAIYVTGKVNRPGRHMIPLPQDGSLGVYEAVLIAGGLSNFGDPERVHVLREDAQGKRVKIPVNIRQIEKGAKSDPAIGDGDIVVVPEKVFGF